jgi:hypothetical protein
VGVFAFTGSGKSNLTSLVIKKATKSIPHAKFVIFDISAEYGISIIDLLSSLPSRIVVTDEIPGQTSSAKASEYLKRHVCPEGLESCKQELLTMINRLMADNKIKLLDINADSSDATRWYTTYGGLLGSLEELVGEKYGVAAQKILVPTIVDMIRDFMKQNKLVQEDAIDEGFRTVLARINQIFAESNLAKNAALLNIFKNIEIVLDHAPSHTEVEQQEEGFTVSSLVNEILDTSDSSPRIFLIDLPEADMARRFCSDLINKVFRTRRDSFNLTPKIVFIFDEAQEFIPYDKKKEDETETSSRAVERLLRHGRKYNLHGWISTQRIAHLNTNALQQLHSYFVSTMPRPYDRQLIADTFAIDDAFMDRTLSFENGDWLVTSFKATNTQSVPVFFHAYNNEDSILGK